MNNLLQVNGIRIYVERHGLGTPLLMIPGLGAGNWLWTKTVEELSQHFELIMPELRGAGRSDKPDAPYSVELFAKDLKALLDGLDISGVHLLGASLGGLVAQYFAATWPERTQSLVLASTSLGGQSQIGPNGEILCRLIKPRGRTRRERLEDAYDLSFTRQFILDHPQELDRITDWRLEFPQPEFAYYRQLLAGNAFTGDDYASKINARTLILAGEQDQVVPLEDVQALHETLPNARLLTFPGKHLFFFEHHTAFNRAIIDFLKTESK